MKLLNKVFKRIKWYYFCLFKFVFEIKIRRTIKNNTSKFTIYLFANPIHSNLGDQAQTLCILRWFKKYYPTYKVICIPMQLCTSYTFSLLELKVNETDKIFIHSGYLTCEMYNYLPFMCEIVERFSNNNIIILPQTINIETKYMQEYVAQRYNKHRKLTLMCRDDVSYNKAKDLFTCNLLLYPDFVTTLIGDSEFNYNNTRNGILFVIRDDKEKLYMDNHINKLKHEFELKGIKVHQIDTTIDVSPFTWIWNRERMIKKYLNLFSKYEIVVTDRYHGTIFSQIVSTPTIVLSSKDHKLSSGIKWFPNEEFDGRIFFAKDIHEVLQLSEHILISTQQTVCQSEYFDRNYWSKLSKILDNN